MVKENGLLAQEGGGEYCLYERKEGKGKEGMGKVTLAEITDQ